MARRIKISPLSVFISVIQSRISRQALKFVNQILVLGGVFMREVYFDYCLGKGCIAITDYLL